MSDLIDLFRLDLSLHGWLALVIACVGVAGLHLGLMHLARRRHDPDDDGEDTGSRNGG